MPVTPFPNGKTPGPPKRPSILEDPALDPENRLKLVLQALQRAQEEWDESCRVADDIDPEHADILESARKDVRACYRRWFEIAQQAHDLSENLRRTSLELPMQSQFEREYTALLDELKEQFEGGPHYDLLCERVARLHVRLKQMESSGRAYTPSEHAQLNNQLLSFVGQLQKYTEAMKSESISREAQAVAEQILAVVEKRLSTSHPELWLDIMKDVRAGLEAVA